ncbi:ATP-binding protein [Kitasatospora sp. NPDC093558]|uniref:ATP-binding protein n=1 Tax=Kitasatospora sp. NPDC093558 TaxID=3155201 RepID=UPI003442556B
MPETDAPVATRGCWFPRSRRSPLLARRMLRELLATMPDGDRYSEVGELLTSELVGNAVLHSGMPGRLIWVSFDVSATRLRIEVHDASDRPPVSQQPDPLAGRGRGLLLVEVLATEWGHSPRPGVGKVVWCECAPKPLVATA